MQLSRNIFKGGAASLPATTLGSAWRVQALGWARKTGYGIAHPWHVTAALGLACRGHLSRHRQRRDQADVALAFTTGSAVSRKPMERMTSITVASSGLPSGRSAF